MPEPLIKIAHVNKTFQGVSGDVVALNDVNLNIDENEFVAIVGPSGCGKTTLLNILAGLELYDSGSVTMNNEPIVGPGIDRGVIFQQYALFPWLTVRKNMEFGLRYRHHSKEKQKEIVDHYMEMVGLTEFANAYPKELSGGMKQRVAIARGYATSPTVLLMDEPFGALDAQTREVMHELLLRLFEIERHTILFVTRDHIDSIQVPALPPPGERRPELKLAPEFLRYKQLVLERIRATSGVRHDLDKLNHLAELSRRARRD